MSIEPNIYSFVKNSIINNTDWLGKYTIKLALMLEFDKLHPELHHFVEPGGGKDLTRDLPSFTRWHATFTKWMNSLSDQEAFNIWYNWEKERGNWWESLSDRKCPRKLCKENGKYVRPEKGKENWNEPERPAKAELLLHPGAVWTMRSQPNADRHANQCTYDDEGVLLLEPPGSGTVDWHKTGKYDMEHWAHDVEPIDLADYIDRQSGAGGRKRTFLRDILGTKVGMGRSISTTVGANMAKYYEVRPLYAEPE